MNESIVEFDHYLSLKVQHFFQGKVFLDRFFILRDFEAENCGKFRSKFFSIFLSRSNTLSFLFDFAVFAASSFFHCFLWIIQVVVAKFTSHLGIIHLKRQCQTTQSYQFHTLIRKLTDKLIQVVNSKIEGFSLHIHCTADTAQHT